jgi:enterochelin esterase family protein
MSELLNSRLRDLQALPADSRAPALAAFWQEIEQLGAPLIEPASEGYCSVTFLWRDDGTTRGVDVIQDWGADGIREHSMERLPGTELWFKTRLMRSDTRTTYQLAPDPLPQALAGGIPYIVDPLNPRRFSPYFDETGFTIWFSSLVLPEAAAQPWVNAGVPEGTVTLYTPFEDGRRIWVYTPNPRSAAPYSLLAAFDGRLVKDIVDLPAMLDVQIAAGKMAPTIALLIDNPDRSELQCDPQFAEYVAERIVPWARSTFPVAQDPAHTVVTGSSFGGLCAAYLGLRYPSVFGGVLSQTGWFRWHPEHDPEHEWLTRQFVERPTQPVRFSLDVGNLENARMADGGLTQLAANRHMRDVLRAKGYAVNYREYSGGHDYSSLQNSLFDALPWVLDINS